MTKNCRAAICGQNDTSWLEGKKKKEEQMKKSDKDEAAES